MAAPSNPNQELLFQFTITPLTKFREAIEALIDQDFNPIGNGVIEVSEKGVDFTARNVNTEVTGLLRLRSTGFKDFHFNSRCKDKLMRVNFRSIFLNISDFFEWGTFSLFDGSDNINVKLGDKYIVKKFGIDLEFLTMGLEFDRIPEIRIFCEVKIPCNLLREMLLRLEVLRNDQLVSVRMTEKIVTVVIGDHMLPWILDFNNHNQVGGTRGMKPGQNHKGRFKWHHLEVLKKASHITPTFVIGFLLQPRGMIMTRFILPGLGDLLFFEKATAIIYGSNLIPSILLL